MVPILEADVACVTGRAVVRVEIRQIGEAVKGRVGHIRQAQARVPQQQILQLRYRQAGIALGTQLAQLPVGQVPAPGAAGEQGSQVHVRSPVKGDRQKQVGPLGRQHVEAAAAEPAELLLRQQAGPLGQGHPGLLRRGCVLSDRRGGEMHRLDGIPRYALPAQAAGTQPQHQAHCQQQYRLFHGDSFPEVNVGFSLTVLAVYRSFSAKSSQNGE